MTKLWQKSYSLNEQVERFEAAQNSALDARLIRHDVWGSLAHAARPFACKSPFTVDIAS